MECAAKGRGSRCIGAATRRCARCGAVAYCSLSHQITHWSHHKQECERLEQQRKSVDVLNDFPFTFSREATFEICEKQETRCSFLSKTGLHKIGMWMHECHCGASCASFDCLGLNNEWDLPRTLCPCFGPEKELLQLAVFGELQALFPGVRVHIELVGPAIPEHRDGERISISKYACCNEDECVCKLSSENVTLGTQADITSAVRLQLWRGFYHDRYRDVVKDSFPNIIIAPNAGIAAYSSWLPSIELMEKINVPVIFTDYCEEASHLAASCINSVTGRPLTLPVQLNPFRQPMVVERSVLLLPCYSNCFLFGM